MSLLCANSGLMQRSKGSLFHQLVGERKQIRRVADYCETDIVNTYRVWLRYELFRGRLTNEVFATSEANLVEFIKLRGNTKPHLIDLTQ